MAHTTRKRRLEAKTDYRTRLALLKSGKPRLVVRKTNRYVIAQIVESENARDRTIVGVTSRLLLDHGWPKENAGSLKSLHACYLTGLLLGRKATKSKIKHAILDAGMHRNVKRSRIYAVLKGAKEGGLEIPSGQGMLPEIKDLSSSEKLGKTFDKLIKAI